MVVPDSNAGRTLVRPTKDNSPLVIDPNRMPASPASFQGFEFIAGRHNQVSEPFGGIYPRSIYAERRGQYWRNVGCAHSQRVLECLCNQRTRSFEPVNAGDDRAGKHVHDGAPRLARGLGLDGDVAPAAADRFRDDFSSETRKRKSCGPLQFLLRNFTAVEAAASCDDKRIYSNDQHVETCDEACAVVFGRRDTRNRSTRVCASAEPGRNATRSNPSAARTIWRIAPACRRAARHRCNACRRTCRAFHRAARARCAPWRRRQLRPPSRPTPRRRKPLHPRLQRPQRPKLPNQRLQQPPQLDSRAAHRFPPSAAHAAPIIRRSARACRPAARRRCNAWGRKKQGELSPGSSRRSPPPAAGAAGGRARGRIAPAGAGAPTAAREALSVRHRAVAMRPREELLVLRRRAVPTSARSRRRAARRRQIVRVWRPRRPRCRRRAMTC